MKIIYEPQRKAGEYAELACNIYKGCTHRCKYCYGPKIFKKLPEKYYSSADPKKDVLPKLREDCKALYGDSREILISFIGDPYQPEEMNLGLTRDVIKTLIEYGLSFTVLTKGGTRACRDFDLLQSYSKCRFGTTLVFREQKDADIWEPGAASVKDRINAIQQAHEIGIKTWISLEPVIDPEQALVLIKELSPIVDHWKIGKINYNKEFENKTDWVKFREKVIDLLEFIKADYYLKKSLTEKTY